VQYYCRAGTPVPELVLLVLLVLQSQPSMPKIVHRYDVTANFLRANKPGSGQQAFLYDEFLRRVVMNKL